MASVASARLLLMGAGVAAAVGLASATAAAPARRPPAPASDLVKVELIADTTHVTAGRSLTLAARFQIAPGWHIYWENPGEAGLATEVAFAAPPGYRLAPVRFPGPERFQNPGEAAASYGYAESVLLSSSVTAPKTAGSRPARFSIQASWLACRDVCIRGQGSASLDLPPATKAQPPRPAHAELFARHRGALPRRFAELRASTRWTRDPAGAHLVVGGLEAGDRIEYFPPAGEDFQLLAQAAAPAAKGGTTELRLTYKPGFKPARARGLLAVTRDAHRRYYVLDLEEVP